MKKLVLTLALVFGVLAANAQYFVGGQFGLLYDDASENTMITIAPEFGYAFNDTWTVAGMIGYTHMDNFNSFYIAPYARWNFWKKDFVGLLVDGGFGISTQKYKGADSDTGFEIGFKYNPQIQISAESGTKRSIFRQKNKTKRSKKRLHTTLIKPEQKVNEDLCSGFIVS